jgi:hypothetical protein
MRMKSQIFALGGDANAVTETGSSPSLRRFLHNQRQ